MEIIGICKLDVIEISCRDSFSSAISTYGVPTESMYYLFCFAQYDHHLFRDKREIGCR
jgi:hypothetical protein